MLSGLKIKEEIKKGNIVISDFDESRLNPNSYNIRLGNKMKVYTKGVVSPEEINNKIKERSSDIQDEYVKICQEFKNDNVSENSLEEINKRNERLQKLYERQEEIKEQVIREYALDPKKENETEEFEISEEGHILLPGVLYLGETMEYTETYGFVPKIDGRSTTGRLGIIIHLTAGFGDNGFKGKWTLEITVTHPVIVYPGMEIGQLYYEEIQGDSSMMYNGKYQDQQGVQAAKVDKYKDKNLYENVNLIHFKDSNGNEKWYDDNGKVTHVKNSDGYEKWYDDNGRLIHVKNVDGNEYWYDENGKVIKKTRVFL